MELVVIKIGFANVSVSVLPGFGFWSGLVGKLWGVLLSESARERNFLELSLKRDVQYVYLKALDSLKAFSMPRSASIT